MKTLLFVSALFTPALLLAENILPSPTSESATRPVLDLNAAGACGDATLATAAKGEATLDFAVDRLVELFAEIERFPLASLNTRPAW